MKIDQAYLKQLLNGFLVSERSFVWPGDLLHDGVELDDKFLFHMQILEDQRFVECLDRRLDLGYEITLGGEFTWHSRPLRLTAAGHEFVDALNRSEIWEVIKAEFQDASVATLTTAAKGLLEAFARKQIQKYLDV
ncbi:MAG TPA: hypothetical protein VGB12_11660 [bacterium]